MSKHAISKFNKKYGEFNKIIYVGDGEWDYMAARDCKIDFIGIAANGNFNKLKKIGVKAEQLFSSFNQDLTKYLDRVYLRGLE